MVLSRKIVTSGGVKSGEGACMYPPLPYVASTVLGSIRNSALGHAHKLPKHLSHQWASPRQGWHKVYGNSRHGRWPAKHFCDVCWGLRLHGWRGLLLKDFHREEQSQECLEPREVLEVPGNELRASKKKRGRVNLILCHLAPRTSVQSPWPRGAPLQRRAFSKILPSCIWT